MSRIFRGEVEGCPITVIHLWEEPIKCAMCDRLDWCDWCVPWYCGPVREGHSEGGYKSVCKPCHDRWAKWDTASGGKEGTK